MPSTRDVIVVAGMGALSHAGIGAAALAQAMRRSERCAENNAFRAVASFTVDAYVSLHTPCFDSVAEMTVVAAALALHDAQWSPTTGDPTRNGLALGTAYGSLAALQRYLQAARPSPLQFVHTFMNAPAGLACAAFRLRGAHALLCSGTLAGLQALRYAALLLRSGKADHMLGGGADSLRAWANTTPPADCRGPLGEGAALLALCRRNECAGQGLAELAGWGTGAAPGPQAAAFGRALESALDDARAASADLAAVVLATGANEAGTDPERQALERCGVGPDRWIDLKARLGETGAAHAALGTVLATCLVGSGLPCVAVNGHDNGRCATLICAPPQPERDAP